MVYIMMLTPVFWHLKLQAELALEKLVKSNIKITRTNDEGRSCNARRVYGDVIGDLNSRRGQVGSTEPRGNATAINAVVPLANMFDYWSN